MTQKSSSRPFRRSLATVFVALVAGAAVASAGIDWRDAAADPHGKWVVVNGVDPRGEAVVITSVATSSATSSRFLTSYLRGETHLAIQRVANDDGTFTVTYSAGGARLTLAANSSPASSPAQLDVVVESDRSGRVTILDSRAGTADYSASHARLRQIPKSDRRALIDAIESYLADAEATPTAIPRFGDSIIGGLLGRGEASIGSGATPQSYPRLVDCKDECAEGCATQCAWECLFGWMACRTCNVACGIGCAVGCGG
jgi:hypothetical protein